MSLNCIPKKSHRYIWASLLFATIIGCGTLIYLSYIYRGEIKPFSLKCDDNSAFFSEKLTLGNCQATCFSKECVQAASCLLENMNTSADPCEDFYSFVCGGMLDKVGEDETISRVNQMQRSTKLTLKSILENPKELTDTVSKKVKIVYDSCMSESASETNAVSTALEFLSDVGIEGWPHLREDFRFSRISMEEAIGKMAAYLEFFFLIFSPTDNEKRHYMGRLNNFTIWASPALMPHDYVHTEYEESIFEILKYFKVDIEESNRIWEDFKSIDAAILKLYVEYSSEDSGESAIGYSCKDNANTSLCSTLKYVVKYTNNTNRYSTDFVYLTQAPHVQNIFVMLANASHRSTANYLALRFFFNHINELNAVFRVLALDHPKLFAKDDNFHFSIDKWENCINWLLIHLPVPLSKVYILNSAYDHQKEEIQSIFVTIRQIATDFINEQLWIESAHREEMKKIIESASNELESLTSTVFNNASFYVEEFHPTNESFLWNSLKFRNSAFKFLSNAFDVDFLLFNPFQTNAFIIEKGVQLTFGIINPPVFLHGLPKLLNLVTLSPIIGHEFGHHLWEYFDNIGNSDDPTNVEYKKKTKCLEDQYSNFEIKKIGKYVKGSQTLYENFPDLVGFELAEQVISKYFEQENASSLVLPALEFPTKQLLYISMAQMWCGTNSEEEETFLYDYSRYALSEARVVNMYRNLKEFSEAFNCPPGSKMNPIQKCSFFESPLA